MSIKEQLRPLEWKVSPSTGNDFAFSPSHRYAILKDDSGKFVVKKTRLADRHTDHCTGFKTFEAAKAFAENDHIEKLSAWLNPDPLSDTLNWFKVAKPKPTTKDKTTQIGCHFEEVNEMVSALLSNYFDEGNRSLSKRFKQADNNFASAVTSEVDKLELLDSLADQIVTAVGVAHMMSFDIVGALTEVNKSNYSKFVDGKAKTDENGKIIKGENYFEPDLEPFVGGSDDR